MEIINYESLHKVTGIFDVVVCDEGQRIASFPKPCKAAKELRDMVDSGTRMIYLSGTPTPESFSQIYHQFWIHPRSPFNEYVNFYKWANRYVTVTKKYVGHGNPVNDYSNANEAMIREKTDHLFITYTQEEAGFDSTVEEKILYVDMSDRTKGMVKMLMDDLVLEGKEHTILADTGVKLQQKCHQLWSGTIKFECGARQILDKTKAEFIQKHFRGKKIAIFYKFIAEGEMLRDAFPNHTDSPEHFSSVEDTTFICQIQSGREGINLSVADCLVMMNIDFSATSYWQGRDRMTSKDRTKENKVYWIFAKGGIEHRVYGAVNNKKDYTLNHFRKDFNIEKK
jgi:hypothetical protein